MELMQHNKFSQWSAIVMAVAMIVGLGLHGLLMSRRGTEGNTITVTGSVKQRVTADLAKWNANISRQSGTGNLQAVIAQVRNDGEKIKKFASTKEKDISATVNVSFELK